MKLAIAIAGIFSISGCATIVNDSHIPLTVSFSDGSTGQCDFKNKRGVWSSRIPTTAVMIRRSDDFLGYDCTTDNGKKSTGYIRSEMEGGKLAASVFFFDLGITDAITDKHRTYQGNIVIPVAQIGSEVSHGGTLSTATPMAQTRKADPSVTTDEAPYSGESTGDTPIGKIVYLNYDPIALYSEPTEQSKRLAILDKKSALTVIALRSQWIQVKTESGQLGWVRAVWIDK